MKTNIPPLVSFNASFLNVYIYATNVRPMADKKC